MKLAISNIAWPAEEDELFLRLIGERGCSGIEIAPGRVWRDPVNVEKEGRLAFKRRVAGFNLEIAAMQALLFGRPDLGLFKTKEAENETIDYLKGLCLLAADLGAQVLVFGSPANRKRDVLPMNIAFERAAEFFSKVAPFSREQGVCICIEPLRPEETDFIFTVNDGLRLVKMVNNPGFGLHLDAKAVSEEGEGSINMLEKIVGEIKHFHINDPDLVEVNSTGAVKHALLGKVLRASGYDRYVSVEMRRMPDHLNAVKNSLEFSKRTYLDAGKA